ncbi:hypothetical protein BH09VER1_BH09VER1_03160 [soil metagenome]
MRLTLRAATISKQMLEGTRPTIKGSRKKYRPTLEIVEKIRSECTAEEIIYLVEQINSLRPQSKNLIKLEYEAPNHEHPPFGPLPLKRQTMQQELRFHVARLSKAKSIFPELLDFEKEVTALILLGEYGKTSALISKFEKKHGYTWFSLEQSMLASELGNGLSASKSWLNIFSKKTGGVPAIVAYYISCRSERNYSPEAFRRALDTLISESKNARDVAEYVRFRCDPFASGKDIALNNALFWAHREHPLDAYLMVLSTISHLHAQDYKSASFIKELVGTLRESIADRRLDVIAAAIGEKIDFADAADSLNHEIFDHYTGGNYALTIENAKLALSSSPTVFSNYELLVKACIYQGESVPSGLPGLQDEILNSLYDLLSHDALQTEAFRKLNKLSDRIGRSALSAGIRGSCSSFLNLGEKDYWRRYAELQNGNVFSALSSDIFTGETRIETVNDLLVHYPKSTYLLLILYCARIVANMPLFELPSAIPSPRKEFFIAKSFQETGDYKTALAKYQTFIDQVISGEFPYSPFGYDEATTHIVECYLALNETSKAIRSIVERYIVSPPSLSHLPVHECLKLVEADSVDLSNEISIPVFVSLTGRDNFRLYLSLANFLSSVDEPTPISWVKSPTFKAGPICNLLLQRVCIPPVLDSLISLPTPEDVEEQRSEILRYLQKADADHFDQYQAELLSIAQSRELRGALKQIDSSKVSVNIQGIEDAHGAKFKEAFSRLRDYLKLDLVLNRITIVIKTSENSQKILDVPVSNAYELFSILFLEIRNAFTSCAQYSLDASLSVRIRHGIITRHIARPFERSRLLSRRLGPGFNFAKNTFWTTRLAPSTDFASKTLDQAFAKFSTDVEAMASTLKNTKLHIRTEKSNPEALFDFTFTHQELYNLFYSKFIGIEDHRLFLSEVFNELLDRTRLCLSNVRSYLENSIRPALLEYVDDFLEGLQEIEPYCEVGELRTALLKARQDTVSEILEVRKWFESLDAYLMEDCEISLAVRTAVGMLKSQYPTFRDSLPFDAPENINIRGRIFTHLVYVIFGLLENAVKHSGLPAEQTSIHGGVVVEDGRIKISVSNSLSKARKDADPAKQLVRLLEDVRMQTTPDRARQEEGSGFYKIFSIISHEFKATSFGFSVDYPNENAIKVTILFTPHIFFA